EDRATARLGAEHQRLGDLSHLAAEPLGRVGRGARTLRELEDITRQPARPQSLLDLPNTGAERGDARLLPAGRRRRFLLRHSPTLSEPLAKIERGPLVGARSTSALGQSEVGAIVILVTVAEQVE